LVLAALQNRTVGERRVGFHIGIQLAGNNGRKREYGQGGMVFRVMNFLLEGDTRGLQACFRSPYSSRYLIARSFAKALTAGSLSGQFAGCS
jgi:hypothetical protein